jgi:TPR repeat protein
MSNDAEAVRRLRFAAEQDNSDAQVDLGFLYLIGSRGLPEDRREAYKLFRRALRRGNEGAWGPLADNAPSNPIAKWLYMWIWYPF